MIDDLLLISTIVVPLLAAVAAAAGGGRAVSLAGTAAWAAACLGLAYRVFATGIHTLQVGGWQAPYGITLVADRLSVIMLVVAVIVGMVVTVAARPTGVIERRLYDPLVLVLLAAYSGAVVAGDLFNMYVWFELLLLASFVLLVTGGKRGQLEGAVKYAVISIVGSMFFLAGVGLTYGMTGTLNMADVAVRVGESDAPVTAVSMVFLFAFGLKAAAFPLYFWLPASYPAASPPVGALFAGLLTKVGIYGLLRLFTLIFTQNVSFTHTAILWIACFTMSAGITGAVVQQSFRRMAAFLVVATAGFMLVGLGLFSPIGLTGSIFYLLEDAIVVATLFLFAGLMEARFGTDRIDVLDGLSGRKPLLTLLFFVPAFSLAGIPPLAGFWSKLMLTRGALEASSYGAAAIMLAVSLLILVAMLRVWFGPFSRTESRPTDRIRGESTSGSAGDAAGAVGGDYVFPVAALALTTIVITISAGWFVEIAALAADDLLNPDRYVSAVLGT